MRRVSRAVIIWISCIFVWISVARAQRGGQEWVTSNADAQRSSWLRSDAKISKEAMLKPGFQFLWKIKLDNEAKQLNSLTQPVLVGNIIGYKGFKSLALIGGSSDTLFSIDYDLGRLYWKTHFDSSPTPDDATVACPGGLTAAATRPAALLPVPAPFGRGNRGPARSMVGQPDQGYPPELAALGRGARGPAPPGGPGGLGGPGGPPRGGGFGAVSSVYAIGGDGMFHQLSVQTGRDVVTRPVKFLPSNSHASGLIVVDDVLYTSTMNECGGTPNGVWAIHLTDSDQAIASWKTGGPNVVGSAGPTIGTDGTIYVATGDGPDSSTSYANSIVALEPKTLKLRDYFTQPKTGFVSSPLVFQYKNKDLIVAGGKDGRLYILDAGSLGGTDHHTPLFVTSNNGTDFPSGAFASWQDSEGTRWFLAPTSNAIASFRLVEQNGLPALQQGWTSREMISPLPPIVINGVVFALSSGEYRPDAQMAVAQRANRSKPAVLYAFDAATGKEFWNSGSSISSFAHSGGLSGGSGQVFVGTYDSMFYAFGFPVEK